MSLVAASLPLWIATVAVLTARYTAPRPVVSLPAPTAADRAAAAELAAAWDDGRGSDWNSVYAAR